MTIPVDAIPTCYVLHHSTTFCAHCASSTQTNAFYAQYTLKSRSGLGTVRQLVPCAKPAFNLPVNTERMAPTTIPYCGMCPTIDLSHLPRPASRANLYDVPGPPMREPTPAQRTASVTRKPTLEELA